ncbi:flagellar protein FlaG [Metabacillus herbersteinensis]|uniref:Flagellar protein FlaG n=1 Tax=Metabacillus herbersteinensis TaxID=283816 RepID=A0ABV6GGX8_9BACI
MSVEKITSQPAIHSTDPTKLNGNRETIEVNQAPPVIKETASKEKLEKVVNSMNEFLEPSNTHLKFELHEKLNEYYVTIVDNHTNEIVREIPSKKWLDMYATMTEFLGFIVDKKI